VVVGDIVALAETIQALPTIFASQLSVL